MIRYFSLPVLLIPVMITSLLCQNTKFEKWQQPSFFRGINICRLLKPNDIKDLKAYNCRFVQLSFAGFNNNLSPYEELPEKISVLDSMVKYCRQNRIYYTISVRQGPGRSDVYFEEIKSSPKSTIWQNQKELVLYAGMLKRMVERYKNDTLFVGICPIMEPNPLSDYLAFTSASLRSRLSQKDINIDMAAINKLMIDSIRQADSLIPILLQNVAYSNPEFYDIMDKQSDNYCVYEFHCYRPSEYVKCSIPDTLKYPGLYISILDFGFRIYDKSYIKNTILRNVRTFQEKYNVPVFLGEFGLLLSQQGGCQFLQDMYDIAREYKWHYAIWNYRGGGDGWDYEKKGTEYWAVVRSSFDPQIETNYNEDNKIQSDFSVYPNVTNDIINVNIKDFDKIKRLGLYDITGNLICDYTNKILNVSNTLDLSGVASGMYMLRLDTGIKVFTNALFKK